MDVDDTDRRVIDALLDDGRATPRELSSATGVSVPVVERRLEDLEERGVVDGYEPRLDYDALGYDVTAVLRVTVDRGVGGDVAGRLADDDQLVSVYEVTGAYDVLAIGRFADVTAMHERVGALTATEGVRDVTTDVVRETVTEHAQFRVGGGEA